MPVPVILPKFGFTLETADIVQWLKREGDAVRAGDPICEVTTDKVNMEVEATEAGTLWNPLYPVGATVPVTEVICYILRPGETPPADAPTTARAAGAVQPAAAMQPASTAATGNGGSDGGGGGGAAATASAPLTPVARRMAAAENLALEAVQGTGRNNRITRRDIEAALARQENTGGKVRATPAARRRAGTLGVDLHTVVGTGVRGRIQQGDVEAAAALLTGADLSTETAAAPAAPAAPVSPAPADAPQVVRLSGMRLTIATRLQKSFQTAPHIFLEASIDTSAIEALRLRAKAQERRLSLTTVLVKATAWTLMQHPKVNATITGDEVSYWSTVNIGIAVALDDGLVVPVVHHVERLGLNEIQTQTDALVARARSNKLHLNDMTDGTFTISNMGMYRVDRFTAIINPPQVAILAVGRTIPTFVPDADGKPVLKPMMNITLSADHRVVDGADAAKFIDALRQVLEDPTGMLF